MPGKDPAYPGTHGPSHYYAARNTDSSPLRIGNEQEKMIFYRGLGEFYLGRKEQATQDFDRAYLLDPTLLQSFLAIAQTRSQLG